MRKVVLTDITPERYLMLGDAALQAGDAQLAYNLYTAAAQDSKGFFWLRLRLRLGLARHPNSRTLTSFAVLKAIDDAKFIFVGEGLATWQKTTPFMEDRRFLDLIDRHAELAPLPNWHWNLQTVLWAVNQARRVPGDFVELGVFKGHTTRFVADYVDFAQWDKRWFLYDTFDGIPDDQLDAGWAENNETAYRGTYAFETVRDLFAPFPNIEVVKGRVPEILRERPPGPIAFMHVDLNNVAAEIAALDALYDQVSPGGVIVLDDYLWAVSRKQYDAENAWFAERGLKILPMPTGQGVVVKPPA